jgi:hypothetical protein
MSLLPRHNQNLLINIPQGCSYPVALMLCICYVMHVYALWFNCLWTFKMLSRLHISLILFFLRLQSNQSSVCLSVRHLSGMRVCYRTCYFNTLTARTHGVRKFHHCDDPWGRHFCKPHGWTTCSANYVNRMGHTKLSTHGGTIIKTHHFQNIGGQYWIK